MSDCQACGLCCVVLNGSSRCGVVTQTDYDRMSADMKKFVMIDGGQLSGMKSKTIDRDDGVLVTVCAALRGTPSHRCMCSFYGERPQDCRDFTEGGAPCVAAKANVTAQIKARQRLMRRPETGKLDAPPGNNLIVECAYCGEMIHVKRMIGPEAGKIPSGPPVFCSTQCRDHYTV